MSEHIERPSGASDKPEIEITPEMIKAGVAVYWHRDSRINDEEDIVAAIFEAMLEVCVFPEENIGR